MSDSSAPALQSPLPRRNRYHRRGARACDECRLRKRKCNGLSPCSACTTTNNICRFESRKSILAPTQRIRSLEAELRDVRTVLANFKSPSNSTSNVDPVSATDALESPPVSEAEAGDADDSALEEQCIYNMLGKTGYLLKRSHRSEFYFGASSGVSLICKTLELFLKVSETVPSTVNVHFTLLDLFNRPMPEKLKLQNHFAKPHELPSREETSRILDYVFTRCPLVAHSLQYADACQVTNSIYHRGPLHLESCNDQDITFLHSLLAVGYLYYGPLHRIRGCRVMVDEALLHFAAARHAIDISQCNDLRSIQSLLCIIIFLMSTCRIVAAHPYIGVAYSSAMRLGLHCRSSESLYLSIEQRQARKCAMTTILKLDIYCSLVLGLRPFVDLHDLNKDFEVLESEAPSDEVTAGNLAESDAITSELLKKHLELLRITASGLRSVFPHLAASGEEEVADRPLPINKNNLGKVRNRFHQWAGTFSTLVRRMRSSPKDEILKNELEITYYFCQIMLYQPFLHYLKKMADGETSSRLQSKEALACIKVSSIIITRSEQMMQRRLTCSASWMSVYSIFLSVVCLTFLVAAHSGTSRPSEAWRKARSGIQLLVAARCRDGCAAACLDVLMKLSAELSHTVDFDFEQIENSTARICQHAAIQDETADELRGMLLSNETPTPCTSDTENPFTFTDASFTLRPLPLWCDNSTTQIPIDSGGTTPAPYSCNADEILAQAQGISLGHGLDFFLDLEDFAS